MILDSSYGTVADVEMLVPRYTQNGVFTETTRPKVAHVETFINRISAIVNIMLAEQGFKVPVTEQNSQLAVTDFVVNAVADMCMWVNSAGRFVTEKRLIGQQPLTIITAEAEDFLKRNAVGFEMSGAQRDRSLTYGLDYKTPPDEAMFKREAFRWRIR